MPRYHFNDFVLSPRRRLLLRSGSEQPLIPRYFDLLVFLVEHRHEAVHRRDIFERVWRDVTVSDSALSQAIRTIRRVLDDDPKDPRFIRTVSRHGYRFVFSEVREEQEDEGTWPPALSEAALMATDSAPGVRRATSRSGAASTAATLVPPQHTEAILSAEPQAARTTGWTTAASGGAIAGIAAGGLGGLILAAAPDSSAPLAIAPVLAVIGGGCGALGGAGVGAGIALAENRRSSPTNPSVWYGLPRLGPDPISRCAKLTIAAAVGGGIVGLAVQWLTRWALSALVGLDVAVGGGAEGIVIGAGAGLGVALATRSLPGGEVALPRSTRLQAALITAVCCGVSGLCLALTGRPLASGTIHAIAVAADGSRATLAPLARLLGEPDFGPISSAILAFGEAAMFGLGLSFGLLPRRRG